MTALPANDAVELVELAVKATTAYQRPDLAARLRATRERLADPVVRVLVVGEFKQGKSQLVNSLVAAQVCPVDDDIATAVPTLVRYAESPTVTLVREADAVSGEVAPPERTEVPLAELATYVSEAGNPGNTQRLSYAEVGIPSKLLADGLALVDTPGVGGLGSVHGSATMASLASADAVVLVSDASQEYTKPELDFLAAAMKLCPNVLGVLTKTDLYPHWRRIAEIDRGHLGAARISAELIPVSSTLRLAALRSTDKELNAESGFPTLLTYLREQVLGRADQLDRRSTSHDVLGVCEQLTTTMRAELTAQQNPEQVEELVAELERAKARAVQLKDRTARWQITLNDGVTDLGADIEYDLRNRLRQISREAETLVDDSDPAEVWDQFAEWVHKEVAAATSANFIWADERAHWLAQQVAEHFADDGAALLPELRLDPGTGRAAQVTAMERPIAETLSVGEMALSGMRGGYMGGLMFFMPLTLIPGLAIAAPFAAAGAAVVLGRKQLRDEKKRSLERRKAEAKATVRKHVDEVQFQVGTDSRDMLRRVQRALRDHFMTVAEELHTSMTESVTAAQGALRSTEAERTTRIGDLKAELVRVEALAERARTLAATS